MKNMKTTSYSVLAMALLVVGCSSSKQSSPTAAVTPIYYGGYTATPGTTTTPSTSTSASEVTFVPVSLAEMNTYVATHPLNNPSNFKLGVSLKNDGTGRYYGNVKISYTDNGQNYMGTFESGSGVNQDLEYSDSNDLKEYAYNVWFKNNNKTVFSGYFQDQYGAVVLVVDNVVSQGDAQGGSVVSGSVWYMNFPYVQVQQGPARKCWYITEGPYNCISNPVSLKNALNPTDTYRKLGTFSGLVKSQAFAQ